MLVRAFARALGLTLLTAALISLATHIVVGRVLDRLPASLWITMIWLPSLLIGVRSAKRGYERERKRDRMRSGTHCANCGYDMRASVGRCPECGELVHLPLEDLKPRNRL